MNAAEAEGRVLSYKLMHMFLKMAQSNDDLSKISVYHACNLGPLVFL